jgi:hypothetical protein
MLLKALEEGCFPWTTGDRVRQVAECVGSRRAF